MTKPARFKEICDSICELYQRKNADYGDAFGKSFDEYGIVAALIRMGDKMNRIKQLTSSGQQHVNDESVKDTLLDLASYSIMTVIELDERKLLKQ